MFVGSATYSDGAFNSGSSLHQRWQERRGVRGAELLLEPVVAEALLLNPWPENLRGVDRLVHELGQERGPIGLLKLPSWLAPVPVPAVRETTSAARPALAPAPTREELEATMLKLGSVRAMAKHFGRDRRQIYRWLESFGLRSSTKA